MIDRALADLQQLNLAIRDANPVFPIDVGQLVAFGVDGIVVRVALGGEGLARFVLGEHPVRSGWAFPDLSKTLAFSLKIFEIWSSAVLYLGWNCSR